LKTKFRFLFFLLFTFLLISSTACADNLLTNGDFSEVDPDGLPSFWSTDAYVKDDGYTVYSMETGAGPNGSNAARIRNIGENDARFAQTVQVEPESVYRLSGYIRAEAEDGRGANLSVEGIYAFSESVYDSVDEWQYIEWYGETGEDQTSVTIFVRLGGYSGESKGWAQFADIKLEKVSVVPGDQVADLWYKEEQISVFDDEDEEESDASAAWPRLILISLFYTVAAVLILQSFKNRKSEIGQKKPIWILAGGLLIALSLRLMISRFVIGYMVDVNCFTSWGYTMATYGPTEFYPQTNFCDYPPAYTWILGLNSLICRLIPNISDGMRRVVFRFVPAVCDILACMVLELYVERKFPEISAGKRSAAVLLLAFHPVSILNCAAWGQMDSALSILLLLVAIWAMEGKWQWALPCYMLAVLVKPQALMLGPLGLISIILVWMQEKESRGKIVKGVLGAIGVTLLIVVPFSIHQAPLWIIEQYAKTLGSYPYATVNTANVYYLFNGNWNAISNEATSGIGWLFAILCLLYGLYFLYKAQNNPRMGHVQLILSAVFAAYYVICASYRLSWTFIGTAAMVFAFVIVLSLYIEKKDIHFLPYMGGVLFVLLFVFGLKMHERYIFPAFLLLALAFAVQKDWRILVVLLGMTMTTFINEGVVLDNSIRLGSSMGHLNSDTVVLAQILSVINCLTAFYSVYLGVDMVYPGKALKKRPALTEVFKKENRLHWSRKDSLILSAITLVYSVVCFSTLGSTKAPQTAWTSTDYTENVVIDLGEYHEDFCMLYFARVSRYDFSVAISNDGVNWTDETMAQMDQGQCWKWKYVTNSVTAADGTRSYGSERHWFSGRYVRITAHQINLALCEVIFRDTDGNILPVSGAQRYDGDETSPLYSDPNALIDEQDSFEGLPVWFASGESEGEDDPNIAQPSWWNSTYFDEIYHARTAWEFLQGSSPYETSHPPLGKVIMSWGVALFGMTPFGWRFSGAVAGILMLAGIYLIGKQMTGKTFTGAFACLLMALDCMHLTQTQIATIDSYPVLFILFAFFFMLRFIQTDWRTEDTKRVYADLALSGLFMGLAIASKWIGMYAGAGLAVLYFQHCIRILIRDRRENENRVRKEVGKKFLSMCFACVGFFVVMPAVIYLVSYIPYFAYKEVESIWEYLELVYRAQISMFNYHSTPGLGMDHPFYSPWYEWPVMGKPMFYATKQYVFTEELSYSIFCFGNPVIWFGAIGTMMFCAYLYFRERGKRLRSVSENTVLETNLMWILIGFLAQYLPWTFVPRGTYIYHYFASVPFLIFSIVTTVDFARQFFPKVTKAAAAVFAAAALVAFILLFPYVTGIYAPVEWLNIGKGSFLKIWY